MGKRKKRGSQRKTAQTEWDRLSELVGYYVLTGYIQNLDAQSVLLVGPPGSGKSSLVRRFAGAPRSKVVLDITVDGFRKSLLPEAKRKGHRTIIMPEFYKPFQRQGSTVMNMVGMLTAAMSGELDAMLIGPEAMQYDGVQLGFIGAMTTQVYAEWSSTLAAAGILDRLAVLPITWSQAERIAIETKITREDRRDLRPMPWAFPKQLQVIRWTPNLEKRLIELADQILAEDRNRLIHQLIALSRAIALRDGDTRVMVKHVRKLHSYLDFLKHIKPQRG